MEALIMAIKRECTLTNSQYRDSVDLREYADEIKRIIEDTVPNRHPQVYKDHFTTDHLSPGEAVKVGRALSKSEYLAPFGKTVTTFRLFNGRNVDTSDGTNGETMKGGRMR
jgi:hypothetical protein